MEIDPNAVSSLGTSDGESERLQRQADELALDSEAVLERVGLRSGHSASDLGCGPRGIIERLYDRVSPGGRVVGLDSDPAHVAMAAGFVRQRALSGVQIIEADARHTALAGDSFDVVHARTLLVNVPLPAEVLAEMVRLARTGGQVASVEPDCETSICYPAHPVFDRLADLFTVAFSRNGADTLIGRRLAELYRDAGLKDVTIEARAGVHALGHSRRTIWPDLVRTLRSQILALGAAAEQELDELDTAAREHLANPEVVVMGHLFFVATGRRPAAGVKRNESGSQRRRVVAIDRSLQTSSAAHPWEAPHPRAGMVLADPSGVARDQPTLPVFRATRRQGSVPRCCWWEAGGV